MSKNMMQKLRVPSPDGRFIARPGPENTVILLRTASGAVHGCYFGHQDGVYGRRNDRITAISWEQHPGSGLVLISSSSSGSIQRWHPDHCTHISTIHPAHVRESRWDGRQVAG